jgi:hypothetical protein
MVVRTGEIVIFAGLLAKLKKGYSYGTGKNG